jgi:molybdopterin-binding protein
MTYNRANYLSGTVRAMNTEGPMTEVVVETKRGETVRAVLPSNSVDRLGLEPGAPVETLVEAKSLRRRDRRARVVTGGANDRPNAERRA